MRENIASNIIEKCGGIRSTAALISISENAVRKWTYPKEKGGRGGRVPIEAIDALLEAAKRGEVDLKPDDFFDWNLDEQEDSSTGG